MKSFIVICLIEVITSGAIPFSIIKKNETYYQVNFYEFFEKNKQLKSIDTNRFVEKQVCIKKQQEHNRVARRI